MAERVYTATGIVLSKQSIGEASIYALILTDQFGLVRVRAQSARMLSGKLRFALEPMTLGVYSFVRGTQSTRLVGAQAHEVLLSGSAGAPRRAAGQIARLLLRLMPGEAIDETVFPLVCQGLKMLASAEATDIDAIECGVVLSVLSKLGYLSEEGTLSRIAAEPFSPEALHSLRTSRSEAVRTINHALAASGL